MFGFCQCKFLHLPAVVFDEELFNQTVGLNRSLFLYVDPYTMFWPCSGTMLLSREHN